MKLTAQTIFEFAQKTQLVNHSDENGPLTTPWSQELDIPEAEWYFLLNAVNSNHLVVVVADYYISELNLGGDFVVWLAKQVANGIQEGYKLVTWYGEETECLVCFTRGLEVEE